MNPPDSPTMEQVLFDRMGISVEDALATGVDVVDEKVSAAVDAGIDVNARISSLGQLLEKLTDPATVSAMEQLLEQLPQLAKIARFADEMPSILATLVDVIDDYQHRFEADGIDVEKALVNGLHATLWLGSQIKSEHLKRIGDLLASDILNPHAVNVVDNAAKSLTSAQASIGEPGHASRIGVFGLLGAIRKPEIQRSLAFAVRFGEFFGKNLEGDS
jgi:uncharacterized protein YjgD (DUF1641 family)